MKKIIVVLLLFISNNIFACDGCNVFINFSPNDYQNRITFLSRSREMFGEYDMFGKQILTKHASHGNNPLFWNNKIKETYNTLELRGDFYLKEIWKTTIILPYVINKQDIGLDNRFVVTGFGDPTILETYQVFNTLKTDDENNKFKQRLELGLGLKLPLGKTDLSFEKGIPNLDLQPGTGSFDLLTTLVYLIKVKDFGLSSNVNFKMNGYNKEDYKYGNTFNSTAHLFWQTKIKNFTLMPLIGAYVELMTTDKSIYRQNGSVLLTEYFDTGGQILFGSVGAKCYYENFSLSVNYQHKMYDHLNGYTQLLTKNRLNLGLTYSF
ncbi:MAG: hypothetical protein ACWA41_12405 [Putridiphycobacter sp.]